MTLPAIYGRLIASRGNCFPFGLSSTYDPMAPLAIQTEDDGKTLKNGWGRLENANGTLAWSRE